MRTIVKRQTLVRLIALVIIYLVIFNIHTTLLGTNHASNSDCQVKQGLPWMQAPVGASGAKDLRYMARQVALERRLSPAKDLPQNPRMAFHDHRSQAERETGTVNRSFVRNGGFVDNTLFDRQGEFFFNASRYPLGKLPIFPDEDATNDDRIWNQMRYIPKQIFSRTAKTKTILLYNGLGGVASGDSRLRDDKCPVRNCYLTGDRSLSASADVIIWQHSVSHPFHRRPPKQVWGVYFLESPYHTPSVSGFTGNSAFNWTATYRHESVIVAPYYKFTPYSPEKAEKARAKAAKTNFAKGKTKKVAWFVSNCGAQNRRLQYAQALGEFIQVDIYGACGKFTCPRSRTNACFQMLSREYKFYLAFENSNCRDYITEKFFLNALSNNILPIVMGAHPDDYRRSSPPHSYIHVDDFATPKDLAAYLKRLDEDDRLYNSYFAWKGSGLVDTNTFFWCRLCMMAHEADNKHYSYSDPEQWWRTGKCVAGAWPGTKRM